MNKLLELVLSRPEGERPSSLEQLLHTDRVFYSLPTERISMLAASQNRNYEQMLRHLVDIGLVQYPDIDRPSP